MQVHCATAPVVELGSEYAGADASWLQVCYLQHALGAGEHYNSVAPLEAALEGLAVGGD